MTEHDHDIITAVRKFGEAVVASSSALAAARSRLASAFTRPPKLAKVLGRKPSDEEIELVIPG